MNSSKGNTRMSKSEILELLELKGWKTARLAVELDLSENAVQKWLKEDRNPSGPASILMRMWLDEARKNLAVTA